MAVVSIKNKLKSGSLLVGNAAFIPTDFESIATATGTGSSGTITFSSIPSTYTHLQVRWISSDTASANFGQLLRFNNDTTANYAGHSIGGNGSSASAGAYSTSSGNTYIYQGYSGTTSALSVCVLDILDYANTNKNKTTRTLFGQDANGSGNIILYSGLWLSTSAINRIDIVCNGGNFTTASTFALYGIRG